MENPGSCRPRPMSVSRSIDKRRPFRPILLPDIMAGCCFERLLFAISVTFDEYLNSFKNYQRDELGSGIIEVIRIRCEFHICVCDLPHHLRRHRGFDRPEQSGIGNAPRVIFVTAIYPACKMNPNIDCYRVVQYLSYTFNHVKVPARV